MPKLLQNVPQNEHKYIWKISEKTLEIRYYEMLPLGGALENFHTCLQLHPI